MLPGSVGAGARSNVRSRGSHPQPVGREPVFDTELERERISGPRMERVLHQDAARLALPHGPGGPAHQAVDRVLLRYVVDRELVPASVELVAAVLDPVGPRDQHLAPARPAHLVHRIAVEHWATRPRALAEPDADLPQVSVRDLDLLPGRRAQRSASSSSMLRWASVYKRPIAGRTTTTATPKMTSTAVKVSLAAAPCSILSVSGSR